MSKTLLSVPTMIYNHLSYPQYFCSAFSILCLGDTRFLVQYSISHDDSQINCLYTADEQLHKTK